MKKKIFAVSDIHGHASLLRSALSEAGFIEDCPDHLLVVLGDLFDRGRENLKVYEYLSSLGNKILIRGNHEDILLKALSRGYLTMNDVHNGTASTVSELFNTGIDQEGRFFADETKKAELLDFLDSFVEYYESEKYVFTHGWLPVESEGGCYRIIDDWRYARRSEWYYARWTEWQNMYTRCLALPDKTLVCGHRTASYGHMFDRKRSENDFSPFYGEGVIAIDGCTAASGVVNVIVLEDEVRDADAYSMNLKKLPALAMSEGNKTVELRLFDEKRKFLSVGDTLVFNCPDIPEGQIKTKVVGLYRYPTFEDVLVEYTLADIGFKGFYEGAVISFMNNIYGLEKVEKYGVLAIKIKLIEK